MLATTDQHWSTSAILDSHISHILTHSRFWRFSMLVLAVSGVSLVGVSLLSADVNVRVAVLADLLDPIVARV